MARELIPFDKLFSKERRDNYHARIEAMRAPLPTDHGSSVPVSGSAATPASGPVSPDVIKQRAAPDDPMDSREAVRKMVSIRADIKESAGGKFQVWVVDLSNTGFRIKLLTTLEQNKAQFLMLPGFQPLAAHIAWREGDEYGMRFDKPLHISVFEHIARSFPGISGGAH